MEFKVIVWIIIGMIWVFSQLRKGIKAAQKNAPKKVEVTQALSKLPVKPLQGKQPLPTKDITYRSSTKNIERLRPLRKPSLFNTKILKTNSTPVSEKSDVPLKKYTTVDYDDQIPDEEDIAKKKIENDRVLALESKKHGTILRDEHFQPYVLELSNQSRLMQMLQNPEDVKAAFIVGEIFRKKYVE